MRFLARAAAAIFFLGPAAAFAQTTAETPLDLFDPSLVGPKDDFGGQALPDAFAPLPYAPSSEATPTAPLATHDLTLEARLTEGGAPLAEGITWRVFKPEPGADGQLQTVAKALGGTATVQLSPGDYLVHAAFGRAGATKRVTVAGDDRVEAVVLNAGGLKLDAIVGDDAPVRTDRLSFEVLQESETGELVPVVPKATPGLVLRLAAGTYHVISRYGDINAIVRADIEVRAGKLTEAVMRHTGAEATLKLVSDEGGEALANTSWTVLNENLETVHQSVGAFPSIVLAEGNYSAVAKHQDRIYSRDFTIEAGVDRDVEVRLTDLERVVTSDLVGAGTLPDIAGPPMEP